MPDQCERQQEGQVVDRLVQEARFRNAHVHDQPHAHDQADHEQHDADDHRRLEGPDQGRWPLEQGDACCGDRIRADVGGQIAEGLQGVAHHGCAPGGAPS